MKLKRGQQQITRFLWKAMLPKFCLAKLHKHRSRYTQSAFVPYYKFNKFQIRYRGALYRSVVSIEMIPAPVSYFNLPPPPPIPHCDRETAPPSQPNTATDGARVLYNAGGGLGHW